MIDFLCPREGSHVRYAPEYKPDGTIRIHKKAIKKNLIAFTFVPKRGLEPPRVAALVPKTSVSTNSTTWAGDI